MTSPRIIVIGAGFGGIAVGVELLRAGFTQLTLLEKADRVGGVWRDNTYPDCACDIPAPLYSYSFAVNPEWSTRFPLHSEIQRYLSDTADRFGLTPHLRLGAEVTGASFDEVRQVWDLRLASGERLECDVLVPAVGQLSRPVTPRIDGLATFRGAAFHSARWDHTVPISGRRVAVVGSGASAVQIVPAVARTARHVTVLQRSAPWTLPKPERRYGPVRRRLGRRFPAVLRLPRIGTWAVTTAMGLAVIGNPVASRLMRAISNAQRRIQVPDPELRAKVTPDYDMGCKRVLFTSRWYPALRRPNVELVTEAIERITESGLRTSDGRDHPADVIVFSTGFAATDFLAPMQLTGRAGVELADYWRDGAHAYLGLAVPRFPNLFLMYGPNTNTGNTSVVYYLEAQARYVRQAVQLLAAQGGGSLEVREDVEERYDRNLQERLGRMVWTGCASWYRTEGGRIVTNWPGLPEEYRRRTARLRPTDYLVTARGGRS